MKPPLRILLYILKPLLILLKLSKPHQSRLPYILKPLIKPIEPPHSAAAGQRRSGGPRAVYR
jgi:hypothetical protein